MSKLLFVIAIVGGVTGWIVGQIPVEAEVTTIGFSAYGFSAEAWKPTAECGTPLKPRVAENLLDRALMHGCADAMKAPVTVILVSWGVAAVSFALACVFAFFGVLGRLLFGRRRRLAV